MDDKAIRRGEADPLPLIPFPPRQDRKALRPSRRRNRGNYGRELTYGGLMTLQFFGSGAKSASWRCGIC